MNPYPPNTFRWKAYEDSIRAAVDVIGAVPTSPPAPGGKPIRYDLSSQIDGVKTVFVLPVTPDSLEQLQVYWNGQLMTPPDFSLSGSNLVTTPDGSGNGFIPKPAGPGFPSDKLVVLI